MKPHILDWGTDMKKIINLLGNIRLAFYLILLMSLNLFIGGIYAFYNYSFFNTLNEMPIQDWLLETGLENISLTWWILLFIILALLLGMNTLCCTATRIHSILLQKKSMNRKKIILTLTPSFVHILFIVALLGHLISSGTNSPVKLQLTEEGAINGPNNIVIICKKISTEKFPANTPMEGRIKQVYTEIEITRPGSENQNVILSFGNPLYYGGNLILLHMDKKENYYNPISKKVDESCNKAPIYKVQARNRHELYLIVLADKGFPFVLFSVSVIVLLMIWYYWETKIKKNSIESHKELN